MGQVLGEKLRLKRKLYTHGVAKINQALHCNPIGYRFLEIKIKVLVTEINSILFRMQITTVQKLSFHINSREISIQMLTSFA